MEGVLRKSDPDSISVMVWACARLRYSPAPGFTQAAIKRMVQLMPTVRGPDVPGML